MGWRVFQTMIFGAVLSVNIHWKLTPNPYVASLMGIGASLGATALIVEILEWLIRRRATKQHLATPDASNPQKPGHSRLEADRAIAEAILQPYSPSVSSLVGQQHDQQLLPPGRQEMRR
jgi:hypothetical protein